MTPGEAELFAVALEEEEGQQDRRSWRGDFVLLRGLRDDAAEQRQEMLPGSGLPRWANIDEGPTVPVGNGADLDAVREALNALTVRVDNNARLTNDLKVQVRSLWGAVRLTLTAIVRKAKVDGVFSGN